MTSRVIILHFAALGRYSAGYVASWPAIGMRWADEGDALATGALVAMNQLVAAHSFHTRWFNGADAEAWFDMAEGEEGSGSALVSGVAPSGPMFFASDAEAASIGEGLVARTLPRERWTHAAHLAAALYVLTRRRDLHAERDLPRLIQRYNAVIGVADVGLRGYHETITQFYIRAIRHFLLRRGAGRGLASLCNELIASPLGGRDFIFAYYSREALFSLEAKGRFVEPICGPSPSTTCQFRPRHRRGASGRPSAGARRRRFRTVLRSGSRTPSRRRLAEPALREERTGVRRQRPTGGRRRQEIEGAAARDCARSGKRP